MVERRPLLTVLTHLTLILGAGFVALPVWIAFVASTHGPADFLSGLMPMWPGDRLVENYWQVLSRGESTAGTPPIGLMLVNSTVMALGIAVGKIAVSLISAFAIVYFRFPFRLAAFWIIFLTLMLPVEVRILPTYEVAASLGLLNSYPGLIMPLIASATATFLFRQVFLTIPEELAEASRIDGAGPMKFFRTNSVVYRRVMRSNWSWV